MLDDRNRMDDLARIVRISEPRHDAEKPRNLKLHPVNLRQKAGRRRMIVSWVGFQSAQLGNLILKPGDAVHRGLKFLIAGNHGVAAA